MTEEEKRELEILRKEKRERVQRERAEKALAGAGVPTAFAPLLAGEDDGGTDGRTSAFCAAYQEALAEEIRRRLPGKAPDLTPPAPKRAERGVRRLR